jgi:ABC-type glycerol-3-phosphate transport system permease component
VRYAASRAWLHLALVSAVIVFLMPFLWMVVTSLRADEELTESGFLPHIPTFVPQSPYVRSAPELSKPLDVDPAKWQEMLPRLQKMTRAAVNDFVDKSVEKSPAANGDSVDRAQLADAAVAVVINKLAPKISRDIWSGGSDGIVAAYEALLLPAEAAAAVDDRTARLELRSVQLRTIDAHVSTLCSGKEISEKWKIVSGPAKLLPAAGEASILHYAFSSPSAEPVVLEYAFELPTDPANLHKLFVSIKGDDSWHRVDATLDYGGGHWVSRRTTYIAQHRPSSIILQPPSFDDQTFRNKVWVPLERVGIATNGSTESGLDRRATLRLTISPSSTVRAIYGKVIRNYQRAFNQVPFVRYILNSVVLVMLTTIGTLFSSTFVAYAFARLKWPGRSVAFIVLLSTMMLPGQVTMIAQFMIWRQLGWYNTLNPLWVPAWLGVAFFIFLMTQHMKTIPRELEEAARLDGLNAIQTWWYIIVPLVKPAAAAIAIMTIMGSWNEFMGPLIYLRDQAKFPLSLGLFGLRVDAGNDWTLIMAGNVMMTLPVLIMFFLFQRYFIQGMTMSGMKG